MIPTTFAASNIRSIEAPNVQGLRGIMPAGRIPFPARPNLRVSPLKAASPGSENFPLAPAPATTAYGQMLQYYLKMEPRLFRTAVEDQFARLKEEKMEQEKQHGESTASDSESSSEPAPEAETLSLSTLRGRIEEVKESERRATVEDLMYLCVLEEFVKLGVSMLSKMDNYTGIESVNLEPLMTGIHSQEAIDMVKGHLRGLLGQTEALPPSATLKMSKLQMVQVYAASVMFGYFLRRVDKRFQLAKAMGMLPEDKEDAVARLERLFSMASDDASDPDSARINPDQASQASSSGRPPSSEQKPALRKYIETFDQAMMVQTASIVSKEGLNLLERQTSALWGDAKLLQQQMQEVVGTDAGSMEEIMSRAATAVYEDKVDTVTMSVITQRRAVLEAVAFGTFLRDVETWVDVEYGLLTRLPQSGYLPGQ